jgi:hypothetical protein
MSEWDELKLPFEKMTSTSSVSSEPTKPHQRSSASNSRQNSKRSSPLSIFAHRDKDFSSISRPHTPNSDSSCPSLTTLNNASFDQRISSALREAHDVTEFRLRTQSDTKELRHRNHYTIPVQGDIIMESRRRSRFVNEQDKGDIDTWFAISKACANLGF